jgi:hypothetical protein
MVKFTLRRGYESLQGEEGYGSTVSLTSALEGVVSNATPQPLYPRKRKKLPFEKGTIAENIIPTVI